MIWSETQCLVIKEDIDIDQELKLVGDEYEPLSYCRMSANFATFKSDNAI